MRQQTFDVPDNFHRVVEVVYPPFLYFRLFRSPKSGHPDTPTDSPASEHTGALVIANIVQRHARPGEYNFGQPCAPPTLPRRMSGASPTLNAFLTRHVRPSVRPGCGRAVAGSARRPTLQPPTHFKKRGRYIVAVSHWSLARVKAHALVAVVKSLCVRKKLLTQGGHSSSCLAVVSDKWGRQPRAGGVGITQLHSHNSGKLPSQPARHLPYSYSEFPIRYCTDP